ncbi:MAG TPA: serine hydrolase domain-containing protein [Rhodanobacteraceae bacterium]
MIRIARLALAALAGIATCAAAAPAAPQAATTATYTRLVNAVVAHYHLPGIAVGVIANGKVVYTHVEGKLASGKPMNANTIFKLGSVSKAFTVTLLARLAQEGKLDWKAPVTKYLPGFRMYDPWVTKNMRVADLLSHFSGLHAFEGDLMLWPHPSHFTPADVVHALRYFKPAYSFRAGYAYDNVLFVTAGQVAAAAGGAPYAQLLRQDVFQPLGMDRCEIGTWNRDSVGNVSRPHQWRDGKYVAVPAVGAVHAATTMDAAGGVECSLNDMLIWAQNWLAPTPQQLQWLSAKERATEWVPRNPVPPSHWSKWRKAWNHTWIYNVGRGWFLTNPDGEMTVWHTGVLGGIRAALVLLPNRKSGFIVLLNSGADDALTVMSEVLLKQFTAPASAHSVAWYANALKGYQTPARLPVPDTAARQPATAAEMQADLGVWQDPWFGKVRICPDARGVQFASVMSPLVTGRVMRLGKRYFVKFEHDEEPRAWLDFPAEAGGVLRLTMVNPNNDPSSDFHDLAFTRKAQCQ